MTYERAFLAQADLRIVRGSTIERKIMSTTIKRIALVAVAALGFGVLSVVPSQATPAGITVTVANGQSTLAGGKSDSTTAGSVVIAGLLDAGDSITAALVLKSVPAGGSTDARFINLDSSTATLTNYSVLNGLSTTLAVNETTTGTVKIQKSTASGNISHKFGIQLESATAGRIAGDYVFTVQVKTFVGNSATPLETFVRDVTITIGAAPAAAAAKAAFATAYMQQGASPTFTSVVGDSVTVGSFTAGTTIGQIKVTNASAVGTTAVDTITVSMTGPGYISSAHTSPATVGQSFSIIGVADATLSIVASGVSGPATITITTGVGASFVKTVTFFDTKPVKATATVQKAFIKAGTGSVACIWCSSYRYIGQCD